MKLAKDRFPFSIAVVLSAGLASGCGQGSDGARPTLSSTAHAPPAVKPPAGATSAAPPTVLGSDAPIGACLDDQSGKPYVCDEFYGDASAALDKLKMGCSAISQHWVASCPTEDRVGACKLGMKPYASYELQWSYKGKPPNDSVEALKKVCAKKQKGTFVEAP